MKRVLCFAALLLFTSAELKAQPVLALDGLARVRYEYLVNNGDIGYSGSDEKSYFRFKFSAGLNADFYDFATAYVRFTTESRSYIYNSGNDAAYDINEFVVDNLYLLFPRLFGTLDIKFGRIDLRGRDYGEGFLIEDGTPLDGSRTFYSNAAQFKYHWMDNSVELLTVYNPEYDDLPVINDENRKLNSSDEAGVIIYGKVNATDKLYLEPYYMWKKEEVAKRDKPLKDETDINTFGSYFKYDIGSFMTLRGQAALQAGNYGDEIRRGYGGYVNADFPVKKILSPFSIGYVYLSGDDADTKGQEAWNPLFSRGTGWSEIVASLYTNEAGYGYWTNLQMFKAEIHTKPLEKLSVKAGYYYMMANETISNSAVNIFGGGKTRGNLAMCKVTYDFSKNFTAFAWGEYFVPGDFYYDDAKDAVFVRLEFAAKI